MQPGVSPEHNRCGLKIKKEEMSATAAPLTTDKNRPQESHSSHKCTRKHRLLKQACAYTCKHTQMYKYTYMHAHITDILELSLWWLLSSIPPCLLCPICPSSLQTSPPFPCPPTTAPEAPFTSPFSPSLPCHFSLLSPLLPSSLLSCPFSSLQPLLWGSHSRSWGHWGCLSP